MQILIDTREQKPLFTKGKRIKLDVGDYTTVRLKGKFHIERKSLQDLYGTLVQGNSRFKRELFRAAYHGVKLEVFVEGTYDDFINKRFPKGDERKCDKSKLANLIKTFQKVYYVVFVWCENRKKCISSVQSRLSAMEKSEK